MGKGMHGRLVAIAGLALGAALVVGEAGVPSAGATVLASSASSVFGPAASATLAQKTVQVSFTIGGAALGNTTGGGPFDLRTDTGEYTLHLSIPGVSGGAATPVTAVEILAGDALYLKLPPNLGGSATKPWSESSLSGITGTSAEAKDEDPSTLLQLLAKYATNVSKIGSATVGGTAATEYSATVDPNAFPGATASAKALGSIPIKVWLDSKHRLAQISETIPTPAAAPAAPSAVPTTAASATTSFTMDFSHYGEAVHIAIPPASQVTKD